MRYVHFTYMFTYVILHITFIEKLQSNCDSLPLTLIYV